MQKIRLILMIFISTGIITCKERYNITVKSLDQAFLVVEGNLNCGGPTFIHLSRSFKLDDTARLQPELNAQLSIEGNDNTTYGLLDAGNGMYTSNFAGLTIGRQYRLRIKTTNGKEYLSDYVLAKDNPPIDSLNWLIDNNGVTIYVNTHDPSGHSIYYKWNYLETWEIHSYYFSKYKYSNGFVLPRDTSDSVKICWKSSASSDLILASSAKLQADIILENPVLVIPPGSEKLGVRYSVFVKQYTLSKEAYQYLQIMKKNTQALGSIFDAQPSELNGNIHCITIPSEQVIGFVTSSAEQQKRIFINASQVPSWNFNMICQTDTITNKPDSIRKYIPGHGIPWGALMDPFGTILAYYISSPDCVDCTTRGGTTLKPVFW